MTDLGMNCVYILEEIASWTGQGYTNKSVDAMSQFVMFEVWSHNVICLEKDFFLIIISIYV